MNQEQLLALGLATLSTIAAFWLVRAFSSVMALRKSKNLAQVLANYAPKRGAGEMAENLNESHKLAFGGWFAAAQRNLANQLVAAGLKTSLESWAMICLATAFVTAALVAIASTNFVAALLSAVVSVGFLPAAYLRSKANARSAKFAEELPSLLQVLASSLRAGLSFRQALESAATNDKGEVGVQLRQAIAEVQLDGELEEALFRVADRMKNLELRWLVVALQIQREVGGSLSGVLENVANTIRTRSEIRREIQVLSTEGRFSGYVLVAMPFVVMVILSFIRPGYVQFFFTSPAGILLFAIFGALMIIGWFWMKQLVKIEV